MSISNSHFFVCVVAVCASSLVLPKPISAHQTQIPLYVFGDSLFDFGNNNYINTSRNVNFFPYGETFFNYSSGRYSDGRNIADFVAAYLNLPFIPPYLLPGYQRFTDGVNFASGGAGALVETSRGSVIDLNTQLRYFKDVDTELIKSVGEEETKAFLATTLFLISIGGNDYYAPFVSGSIVLQNFTNEEYVDMVIGNITAVLKEIYKIGGRKFGFLNVPLLGCTPAFKAGFNISGGKCFEAINVLIKLHNKKLPRALRSIHEQLEGFEYSIFDLCTALGQRMRNPSKYGFKEGDNLACCGSGPYRGGRPLCGNKNKKYELCKNPNDYVFFDSIHPTDRVNRQLAKLMWTGNLDIVNPQNVRTLVHK